MPRRQPGLAALRRIAGGVLLFTGLFVLCFGVGYGRQAVMVAGAAIMVLAFGARLTSNLRRTPRRWIRGTGHVIEASDPPPPDVRYARCSIQLVVDAPGLPSETVLVHDSRVPIGLWPQPGHELPIQVAADDVRNVRVVWRGYVPPEVVVEEPSPWDDEPEPVPAEPPGSHLDPPTQTEQPEPYPAEIDFDIDNPPAEPLTPVAPESTPHHAPAAPAQATAPDEGRVDADVPVAEESRQVPRPRPSPRPRRPREPVPVGADAPPAAATAAPSAPAGPSPSAASSASAASEPDDDLTAVSDLVTTFPMAHPGPAGAINGVGVTVLVSDLDQSVEFYRDKLGFYEVDGGEGNLVLASGETRLVLRQAHELGAVNRRLVHLNLEVTDIDAMYEELKENGVRFTYAPRVVNRSARLELWAAAFRDPDGHGIAITQWRPLTGR